MPADDERNVLHVGPPARPGAAEITPAMVDTVRRRIEVAGGTLTVWAVLHEDVYETQSGDGFYLHVRAIALNGDDARRLAALAGDSKWTKWHVRSYPLGLKAGLPALMAAWPRSEEFAIGDFVALLAEIPPGATASKLNTGSGRRADGPFISLPARRERPGEP
jgi:hypothetical protein